MTTYKAFFASLLLTELTACQQQTDSATHVAQLDSVDLVIKNARIYTANPKQPWATSLAVRDGKFLYVGDDNGITRFKAQLLLISGVHCSFPAWWMATLTLVMSMWRALVKWKVIPGSNCWPPLKLTQQSILRKNG